MKTIKSSFGNMICLILPVCIGLIGCSDKSASTQSGDADSATRAVASSPAATNADNSAQNARDRGALTPLDQGNSAPDVAMTAKIRQAVVSGTNNLSMAAKNIKIITKDGSVTLRGPVNNDAEKASVLVLAKGIAGETNVIDQLEVKSTSN